MQKKDTTIIAGRECRFYGTGREPLVIVQPADEHDMRKMNQQVQLIRDATGADFTFCAFYVDNWNEELTPWKANGLFRQGDFGDGAEATLQFIQTQLLPELGTEDRPAIVGGYSLAGLFALWCGYQTPSFAAVCAVSPSVWYPGLMDYVAQHEAISPHVYLSMGDLESKTRNHLLAQAGPNLTRIDSLLMAQGVDHTLEWNEGNHFVNTCVRNAKAFAWAVKAVMNERMKE